MPELTRIPVTVFLSMQELKYIEQKQQENGWSSRSEAIRNLALKEFVAENSSDAAKSE